jgi:hypothetical protein
MDYGDSSFRRGGFTLRMSNIMEEDTINILVEEYRTCTDEDLCWVFRVNDRAAYGPVTFEAIKRVAAERGIELPEQDTRLIESSQNDANQLLRQIESNTAKTAFWTKVVGVPVLIGLIIGALAGLTQCN